MGERFVTNGEPVLLSLVIPVYNEEDLIDSLIRDCTEYFQNQRIPFELLLADDGSEDRSADRIRSRLSDNIRLVSLDRNRGKGAAVRKGILNARGRFVFYTDSDLAYGLEPIPLMMEILKSEADLVLGSRTVSGGGYGTYPLMRKIFSRIYSSVITLGSGVHYDTQCGLKGFRTGCAKKIFEQVHTEGYAFDLEVLLLAERNGMRISQYPVTILHQGESRIRLVQSSLEMLRDVRLLRKRFRKEK